MAARKVKEEGCGAKEERIAIMSTPTIEGYITRMNTPAVEGYITRELPPREGPDGKKYFAFILEPILGYVPKAKKSKLPA